MKTPEFLCNVMLPALSLALLISTAAAADDPVPVKQIAIIGAGAAGSSTAYHLRRFADREGIVVNITLFEKTGRIGGRSLTVNAYDDPKQPVELGASIFVEANLILQNATKHFNLPVTNIGADEDGLLGVWNGEEFVYQQDSESWDWWNLVKLFWKYGMAPYHVRNLVQEAQASFLKLYHEPYFPFRSLTTRAYQLGLNRFTGVTAQQLLADRKLLGPFAHDIVQTATRVNYASNLAYIHGLGALVSMAPEGAVSIAGGNWQLFASMVSESRAYANLNTSVTSIALKKSKEPTTPAAKYVISTKQPGATLSQADKQDVEFDDVVIATPWQFSEITAGDDVMQHPIDEIPYATLHVTLFASPYRFSPGFFKLEPATRVPISVLTTLGRDEEPRRGSGGAGKAGFFSASLVRKLVNPKTKRQEYVYKVFSPEKVTSEFLSALLGTDVPDTITRSLDKTDGSESHMVDPISWYHRAIFRPYPEKLPRVTFQDPIIREGLYYTSGMESFISTMETNALMGMNVARLIVNDYLGLGGLREKDNASVGVAVDMEQEVLQDFRDGADGVAGEL